MKIGAVLAFALAAAPLPGTADVVTDWDDIAVRTIQPPGPVPPIGADAAFRASAMVNVAMFNAVNCVEPKYIQKMQPEPAPDASQDAAAATAAADVLMKLIPNSNVKQQLADYLAKIPDGPGKLHGIKVGEEAAARIVELRANDGYSARNAYRPVTEPGKYTITGSTVGWWAAKATPFVLNSPDQFRPAPPPDLKSDTWARDYNEIKELGEKVQHQVYAAADRNSPPLAGARTDRLPSVGAPDPGRDAYVGDRYGTVYGTGPWPKPTRCNRCLPRSIITCSGDR